MPLKTPELTKFTTASPILASFPAVDIANGTGDQTYHLVQVMKSGGLDLILSPTAIEVEAPASGGNGWNSTTYAAFDLGPYNLPRAIRGVVSFVGMVNHTGTDATISAKLYHVESDGTTETLIGDEVTSQTKNQDLNFNLSFDVARKQFKSGEYLRLYVKMSNVALKISIDPTDTTPAGITHSKLIVPYITGV